MLMTYKIKIRPKALKFIEKQDKIQRLRIYKAIYNLPNGDIKKLSGSRDEYRLRIRWLPYNIWIKSKWIDNLNYKS